MNLYPKPAFRRRQAAAVGLALLLSSCAPGSDLPPLPHQSEGPYRLGSNDEVKVTVFGQEQLSGEFHVNDSGNIDMPLLGIVHAGGLSITQLAQSIQHALVARSLLEKPTVAVDVVSYRPVFVLGEVNKPGRYPFEPGMSVLTAVAVAGGFTYRAVTGYASVLRRTNGHVVEGRARRTTLLEPGDVVDILERHF